MSKLRVAEGPDRLTITLDSPPLNILDTPMLEELRDVLGGGPRGKPLVVIDAAGEKAFSAGASVLDHLGEHVRPMLAAFHETLRRLHGLEAVTVAKVDGACLGGGCELAMACDFVLASDRARFGQPEILLGVFPPAAAWQLSHRLPPRKGLELFLVGDPIDAAEAQSVGMVNAVFPVAEFNARCEAWLARLTRHSTSSLLLAKRAFRLAAGEDFAQKLGATETLYLEELMKTEDANEGLIAFVEKRRPVWKGR